MGKNSDTRRVIVKFHAGYKGEEEPRTVMAGEEEWTVADIRQRRRISNHETGELYEEFTCLVNTKPAKLSIFPNGRHYLTFLKI